jgi:UPF0755 protein
MLRRFLILVLLLIVAFAGWLAYGLYLPKNPGGQTFVMLRPGSSARHIASELRARGIIRSTPAFLLLHYWKGLHSLKAGEYEFNHPASALEVYRRITRGDVYFHAVVIPEGFNIYDVANTMQAAGLASRDDFLAAAHTYRTLVSDIDPGATSLEGYLFPDTYQFTRTQSMSDMLSQMVRRFRQEARAAGLTSRYHEVVTMASIVEKETGVPDERPLVASVMYNRLDRRMVLATDPTVIYAALLAGRYNGVIHQSDLHFDSPYNTYHRAGLPPGPICNPGLASLQAAMHPAQTDYLYFVSDNQGHHRFSRSIEEHARNVAAYRHALTAQR